MKRMSTLFGALFVVAALASSVVAASASAAKVPGFLLLSGESGTLTFTGSSSEVTELQSAAGTLTGKGVTLTIALSSDDEGTYTANFSNVVNKNGESCNSAGDAAKTVLVTGNKVRTAHDETSTTGNGLLFEVGEFEIVCNTEKIKTRGTDLGLFKGGTKEGSDFTTYTGELLCKNKTGGEPSDEKFWGLSGVEEKAKLESNFGSGFKKGCELVNGTVTLSGNKMSEMMEVG